MSPPDDGSAGQGLSVVGVVLIVSTAVLWGATDACIKYISPPAAERPGLVSYFLSLLSTPSYLLCLLFNQLGSLLYYYSLATAPLTLVSPIVNTGKVLVNVCVGRLFNEKPLSNRKIVGLMILLTGITLQLTA